MKAVGKEVAFNHQGDTESGEPITINTTRKTHRVEYGAE